MIVYVSSATCYINMSTKCALSRSHHNQMFISTAGRDSGGGTGDKVRDDDDDDDV